VSQGKAPHSPSTNLAVPAWNAVISSAELSLVSDSTGRSSAQVRHAALYAAASSAGTYDASSLKKDDSRRAIIGHWRPSNAPPK